MDRRKIMALGRSSLVISLPKDWLDKNNLKRGDYVFTTIEEDFSLILQSSPTAMKKPMEISLSISVDEKGESVIRKIIGCYLNGYSLIKLKSAKIFTVEQQRYIRSVMGSLYMRIIESTSSIVTLQTLMDESLASVKSGIERMHIITNSMCQDLLKAMKEWDVDLAKSVVSLEDDVNQFSYFLLRLIRSAAHNPSLANLLELDMIDCLDYQTLVQLIEHIADYSTSIAENIIYLFENRQFLPKEIFSVIIKTADIAFSSYDDAVQSFVNKELKSTNAIIDSQEEIENLGETITPIPYYGEQDEKKILCHICLIRDKIKRMGEYASDIAELTIDRAYKI
jgi:phosphate uptake regulator